ncbi:helix-turn-helix domain-containing protein [Echinicola jeungdonensis]|uniref:Helix-turn-helix domain-containing protein n=1 Tax=Echinicola jeungdonensis TaxID=709343 RepID=A0ABV5J553_9BACT|nr:helix-turn-helix domain-containing protein [Echinicola jeungdonensis]MDN3667939.1 helix-turn-helix domain-containing protein [Echinicola jeungdonensis]
MNFIRQIERMQILNKLIKEQRTGTPNELAERLGVSRRQLYTYIDYLKDLGLDVWFSRKQNSFVYNDDEEIQLDLKIRVLGKTDVSKINGGKILKDFLPCFFYARTENKLVI